MRRRFFPMLFQSGTAAFSPLSLSPVVWFDFSDLTTLFQDDAGTTPVTADAQTIGMVTDKSGNNRHALQATALRRPVYKANIQNGKSVSRYDLSTALASTFGATFSQPNTIFIVAKITTLEGNNFALFDGIATSNRHTIIAVTTSTPDSYYLYAGSNLQPAVSVPKNSFVVFLTLWNGASSQLWENGTSKFTGNPGTNTLTGLTLGWSWNATGAGLKGDICELLVFNAALSDANHANMLIYLNTKWAVY